MKHLLLILPVVLGTALVLAGAAEPKKFRSKANQGVKRSFTFPSGTNAFVLPQPQLRQPETMARRIKPAQRIFPEPGIYKTAPYALIVVAPTSCGDERVIVPGGDTTVQMPSIKPDLEFIPQEWASK